MSAKCRVREHLDFTRTQIGEKKKLRWWLSKLLIVTVYHRSIFQQCFPHWISDAF